MEIKNKSMFYSAWNDIRKPILEKLEKLNKDIPLVCNEDELREAIRQKKMHNGRREQTDN